jgi:geranylgeranyl pyrophosphate synthase
MDPKQDSLRIIDLYGAKIAQKVRASLLEDQNLSQIKLELDYIAKNWYDPLTPALITMSFRSIKEKEKINKEIGLALGLMNLTINLWDNILDNHSTKLFKDTFYGKFGRETSLLVGGLALARANNVMLQSKIRASKKRMISTHIFDMWNILGLTEINDFKLAGNHSERKFAKIANEAIYEETLMKIGATLGGGTLRENQALSQYGHYLGIILEVVKDLELSLNFTAQLPERLSANKPPFSLLWANENSKKVNDIFQRILNKQIIQPKDIEMLVLATIQAGTIEHVLEIVEVSCQQSILEISALKDSDAKVNLKKFVGAQLQLFREKFSLT